MSQSTPYETLGVAEDASFEEIQSARQRLSQKYQGNTQVMEAIECVGEFDLSLKAALRHAAEWPALKAALDPQAEFIDRVRLRPVARVVKRAIPHPLLAGDSA